MAVYIVFVAVLLAAKDVAVGALVANIDLVWKGSAYSGRTAWVVWVEVPGRQMKALVRAKQQVQLEPIFSTLLEEEVQVVVPV